MTTYQYLCLFGIPALLSGMIGFIIARLKGIMQDNKALRYGIQAILRDRLYQLYALCKKNNGATISQRENFENLYKQYHTLGANGVMDDIHEKFKALPIADGDDC